MTWVITRLCADCVDTACVKVCPVDCIYGLTVEDSRYKKQLFIHPDECINCSACEPECPWGAIFEDSEVPGIFLDDILINAEIFKEHDHKDFTTTPHPVKENPTPGEIEENKKKWGFQ